MTMKTVNIYERLRRLFVSPSSQTTDGIWIVTEPVEVLEYESSLGEIGNALSAAFAASKQGISPPLDPNTPMNSLPNLAGVRSWREFEKGAKLVIVTQEESSITVSRWQNLGAGKGFVPDMTESGTLILSPNISNLDIGIAVKRSLEENKWNTLI